MTELATGLPAQRSGDADATADATYAGAPQAGTPYAAAPEPAAPTSDVDGSVAGDAVEPASGTSLTALRDSAADAAQRVGVFANETVDRAGDAVANAAAASGRIAADVVDRLRNNAELAAERGTTIIADEVVEKIAGIAAREVPGVYDLGGDVARIFASVKERVGLGEADEENRGISVRLEGREAVIRIVLVIEYGFVVYSVTEKVRTKVIGSVENLLGLEVTAVDIVVDDIHIDETSGPVGNDEARAAGYPA